MLIVRGVGGWGSDLRANSCRCQKEVGKSSPGADSMVGQFIGGKGKDGRAESNWGNRKKSWRVETNREKGSRRRLGVKETSRKKERRISKVITGAGKGGFGGRGGRGSKRCRRSTPREIWPKEPILQKHGRKGSKTEREGIIMGGQAIRRHI